MGSTSGEKKHVAFLAFPFGTHAPPLFSVARALAAANPDVSFSFFSSDRSNATLIAAIAGEEHHVSTPNLRHYDVFDGVPKQEDGASPFPPPAEVSFFLDVSPRNFKEAMAEAERIAGKFSCVVSDAFLWFAGELAEVAGAEWVPLWTGGPGSLVAHLHTDLLRRHVGILGKNDGGDTSSRMEEDLAVVIPSLSSVKVKDLPEGIVFGDLTGAFAEMLERMLAVLQARPRTLAVNTFEGLDPALDEILRRNIKNYLPIGPVGFLFGATGSSVNSPASETDKNGCLKWLEGKEEETVVYVSFGSMVVPPPALLTDIATGLEKSGVPFVWSLKAAAQKHLSPEFLSRTAGRGLVVNWAPQPRVLEHKAVGAFVTHCGWNSVLEGLAAGVPMICLPFFGDQRLNAAVISRVWKVGVVIAGDGGAAAVAGALKSVLGSSEEAAAMKLEASKLRRLVYQAISQGGGRSLAHLHELSKMVVGGGHT